MNLDVVQSALAIGCLNGAAVLLPTLAVGLLYEHGRYLPLWLADLGLIGAYLVHALLEARLPLVVALLGAWVACVGVAWWVHRFLIADFLRKGDSLSPLLIGLGLSQVFQAGAALYGQGMSQHYPPNPLERTTFSSTFGVSYSQVDVGFVVAAFVATLGLGSFLKWTHLGARVRAVVANPNYSRSLGLPVKAVDFLVLASAATLAGLGGVMRGVRFDLQPNMMFYPGLAAVAACVAAGRGRRVAALVVAVLVEVLVALLGVFPWSSPLQRAVPFVLLVVVLLARSGPLPRNEGSSETTR